MRKVILALAIAAMLALPGITFGQPAPAPWEIAVQENGTGLTSIDFPLGTPSLVIDVIVISPPNNGFDGASFYITTDKNAGGLTSGDADWIYDPSVPFTNSGLFTFIGPASPADEYLSGIGNGGYNGAPLAAPIAAGVAEAWWAGGLLPQAGPAGAVIATYEIQPIGVAVGDTYLLFASDKPPLPVGQGYSGYYGYYGGPWQMEHPLLINITPEPATALLLLGALPFLRRRR